MLQNVVFAREKVQNSRKNVFITELNFFFASILGSPLKKHHLNPLWNSITVI